MLEIPPLFSRESICSTPVSMVNPSYIRFATSIGLLPWKMTAITAPRRADTTSPGIAGAFLTITTISTTTGIRHTGERLKCADRLSMYKSAVVVSTAPPLALVNPKTVYRIREITRAGVVVQSMELICSNNVVPAIADAKFVVSENGDCLSPKYAPDTIAPAVMAGLIPRPAPIPINAIPTVPADDQELPHAMDINAAARHAQSKKNFGDISFNPR